VDIGERDVQTLFETLFRISTDVEQILELLLEDDDGEEAEEDDA
jgi:hypothetical protein